MGLTMALVLIGDLFWDAGGGNCCEDPSGAIRSGQVDQGDLSGLASIAESGPQGASV